MFFKKIFYIYAPEYYIWPLEVHYLCLIINVDKNPNKEDLLRIREDIAIDNSELHSIISNKNFVATFDELKGEQLKTAPKGFPKDHEAIDLLRFKQFIVWRNFTDKEVLSKNFTQLADNTFKTMRPFLDYMSEVLTTDLNGSPIS